MWFVIALCILIALTALIMCIPVDFGLRVEAHGKPSVGFTLGWLFGRVKKTFRSGEGEKDAALAAAEAEKKKAIKSNVNINNNWSLGLSSTKKPTYPANSAVGYEPSSIALRSDSNNNRFRPAHRYRPRISVLR